MPFHKKAPLLHLMIGTLTLLPGNNIIDCSRKSLAQEIEKARDGDTIMFTGVCVGAVTVRTSNLTLKGFGSAAVDGNERDAITISGAHGVTLSGFDVRNGFNGILGLNGAHVAITDVTSRRNRLSGISMQAGSSAILTETRTLDNGLNGLDLQTGASAIITRNFTSRGNTVFGINVNGSSLTFTRAAATITGNALGIQVATNGNVFLSDGDTVIDAMQNRATGLTVVSGGQLVSFGGRINAMNNGAFGVSVNSKGGLDLDAGSVLTASGNTAGGVAVQQDSVVTVFNNPANTGVTSSSTIDASANRGNGIAILTGSTLTLVNSAAINSTGNGGLGLLADNGAGITLRHTTLTGNTAGDLILTFGTRAVFQEAVTLGRPAVCDATVLLRGASFACPP